MSVADYLRRFRLGDFRAPSVDEDEFVQVGGFELPKDFTAIVDKANRLESLAAHPAWKDILDALEAEADRKLGALKAAEYGDAAIVAGLAREWRQAESRIRALEEIVLGAVNARDMILLDLSQKYGRDTGDILSEAKLTGQMKAQLKREGMISVEPEDMYDRESG